MDDRFKKELKKLEHDYSNENTLRLGDIYRNYSSELPQRPAADGRWRRLTLRCGTRIKGILLSDWAFLALLGVFVAVLSIFVDGMVYTLQQFQQKAVALSSGNESAFWETGLSFLAWMFYTTSLVAASATFVHAISPQAIGSGIPEMKTIIRGVILRDYLNFKTLVSKTVGIALSLGSGLPIGKMGPFVHIASLVANQMSVVAAKFDPVFFSETRRAECLAAACAVGVACTFSSPVGGVLFSIEVTTMYFSVRSYWRGFFAACCGAATIRLLRGFVAQTEVTVTAFYQTSFKPDAFSVNEMPLFVLLGILCGILGAGYIRAYRELVLFLRNNRVAKTVFQQHWIVYPLFISMVYSLTSFPHGLGDLTTGRLKFANNLRDFFANCTFTEPFSSEFGCSDSVSAHWRGAVVPALLLFLIFHLVFSVVCLTLPVPAGCFMPIFVIGAATGRLMGEVVSLIFSHDLVVICPGIYAVVGAAAFSASVTHSVSVAVMIFEITGQLHFILPVVTSVVVSNAVCAYLQPSFFDTIIKIKHLPFLPDIPPTKSVVHTTYAEDFMVYPVIAIPRNTTFGILRQLLIDGSEIRIFPVIDSTESQMLVGTVSRRYLLELLDAQVGDAARRQEAERRVRKAIETIDEHFHMGHELHKARSESSLSVETALEEGSRSKEAEDSTGRFLVLPVMKESPSRRNAFCSINSVPSLGTISLVSSDGDNQKTHHSRQHCPGVVKNYMKQAKKYLHHMQHSKKEESVLVNMFDLTAEEREEWERNRMEESLVLNDEDIDPAPFQLTARTSLFRIHSIFSMLQLAKAYVTDCGRLVGVVTLADLRCALERSEAVEDKKQPRTTSPVVDILKKSSAEPVVDILTPTLEVVRPTAQVTSTDIETGSVNRKQSASVRYSHGSRRPVNRQMSLAPEAAHTVPAQRTGGLQEAVDYLRRISKT